MTKFTKEQLINQAREEVDFWRERDELIPSQQTAIRLRLAEISMAALMTPKQEPVADVVAWSSPSEERTCDIRWRRHDVKPGPLYTAPPAPVVPEEWQQWIVDAAEYLEGGLEADGELEAEGSIEAKRLLSRRAAMLQVAEPSEPSFREIPNSSTNNCRENAETSTNGWIPCSERLPENSDAVLVCQEGGIVFCAEFDGGEFYPDEFPNVPKQGREITHWMPLPAAPQQEDPQIKK
ncbi:DUF551 domain-containing protein [Citrobacter freundii]|uniref:DUF551 domain-containing protein n=1 Tax=Citrobacter freundii TaxID=546 RepID=UPI0019011764|nr:DUF551 domain-containing protein [Citrobacter freundii]MBJ9313123.1 DUF551 domain-containing protein [Citrobacter freundii]HEI8943242.1 DUF551 domain-containing protein [Citrobacter freundii]HEJ0170285.1 DUF551 domain-containing protein [Citrobacter freundii]